MTLKQLRVSRISPLTSGVKVLDVFFGVKQNSSFVILVEVRGKILWLSAVVMLVSRNPPLLMLTFAAYFCSQLPFKSW